MMAPTFNCGHPRTGENVLTFKNGRKPYTSSRCRQCHNKNQAARNLAARRALRFVIQLHAEGTLSEGQVAAVTGLDRITIRELADALQESVAVKSAAVGRAA